MRKYLTLCLLLLASLVHSQILLQESFDGTTFVPAGWSQQIISTGNPNSGDMPGGLFERAISGSNPTALPRSGAAMVRYRSYDFNVSSSAVLITPVLNLNGRTNVKLRFWMYRDATYPNRDSVVAWVNTAASLTGATVLGKVSRNIAYEPTQTAVGWYQYTFDIPANFNGATNYILLQAVGMYGNNMYLDDVQVEQINNCNGIPVAGNITIDNSVVCGNGTANLAVNGNSDATGVVLQWQRRLNTTNVWTDIPSANATILSNVSVTESQSFRLRVVCSNTNDTAYSNSVSAEVITSTPNDAVCDAITLTRGVTNYCGTTVCATATGDPAFSQSSPNNTVWFRYVATANGRVEVKLKRPDGAGTGLFGWLATYTASGTCPSLTLTEVVNTNNGFNLTTNDSVVLQTPILTAGVTYYFMLDGVNGASGAYCISMPITQIPACATNVSPANLATGVNLPPVVSWSAVPGATSYGLFWSSNGGSTYDSIGSIVNSLSAQVNNTLGNTTYHWYIQPKNTAGNAVGCVITATSFTTIAGPANDFCNSATTLTAGNVVNGTTVNAGASQGVAACVPAAGTADDDVWYQFTAVGDSAIITVQGAAPFDAVVALYGGTCTALTQQGICVDTSFAGGLEILRRGGLTPGQTYYVRVYGWDNGNNNGTFTIQYQSFSTLPVVMDKLVATTTSNKTLLQWKTLSESNNKGFEVERSTDGVVFKAFAFVPSKATTGYSTQPLSYNFTDVFKADKVWYRLRQLDKDGKFSVSNTVLVLHQASGKFQLLPNPANDYVQLLVPNTIPYGKLQYQLRNIQGVSLLSGATVVNGNNTSISMAVKHLPQGTYYLHVVDAKGETRVLPLQKL